MADKKIQELSEKEFMKQWTELGKQVQESKKKLAEYSQEHQRRVRFEQLGLTASDLELLQGTSPVGIESEEKVNK